MIDLGDTVPLAVEVTDADGQLVNAASVVLTVTLPDGGIATPPVTNPSVGRYECDYVPAVAGLHVARWVATDPAAAYADVIDVRGPAEVGVVSLADVKAHLNSASTVDDEELRPVLLAAAERVAQHLGVPELTSPLTATQRLAVLEVTAELWSRSQRARYGGGRPGAGYGGQGADGQPQQMPLRQRLIDLLGAAARPGSSSPRGCFPDPQEWPT